MLTQWTWEIVVTFKHGWAVLSQGHGKGEMRNEVERTRRCVGTFIALVVQQSDKQVAANRSSQKDQGYTQHQCE